MFPNRIHKSKIMAFSGFVNTWVCVRREIIKRTVKIYNVFNIIYRNPWFEEYWQDTFGCLLRHNYPVELQPGENMIKVCDNSFRLSDKIAG